jgi:hypothetical protein
MHLVRLIRFYDNGNICLTSFSPEAVPLYGILSHTWGADGEEITYEELKGGIPRPISNSTRLGFQKLRFCQDRADQDGLRYFWIDTCCINKADSSELSWALNSMFYWYQRAARCYVYMQDVPSHDMTRFERSRWFRRGWTLQELIAPSSVVFYAQNGSRLGDKSSLEKTIHRITNIHVHALRMDRPLKEFSIEDRFSWANGRDTTRPEDAAYCLLGVFDVWMTPVYSDGDHRHLRDKALEALREKLPNARAMNYRAADLVRVGGASWFDLSALNESELQQLDQELHVYTNWFVQQGQPPSQQNLRKMSMQADQKMCDLLRRSKVKYFNAKNLSHEKYSWEKPWDCFLSDPSKFERVKGYLEARWWVATANDTALHQMGIMATRTLLHLASWRGLQRSL